MRGASDWRTATTVLFVPERREARHAARLAVACLYVRGRERRPSTRREVAAWLRDPDGVGYRVEVGS